jgi:hypothetical protein
MKIKAIILASVAVAAVTAAMPASAAPILFQLSGAKTASFTIDSDRVPDFFSSNIFGNQISYNSVAGTFGGAPGVGTIGFGTSIFAQLNIGGTALEFTQYAGPDLFSLVNSKPVFNQGSFALSSITSGPATLTISSGVAPGVPEPATWAMMLLGFAGIGFALRNTRQAKVRVRFA